mmetsp:Transcript_536/g.1415  ORF Transcript_536/g.1415 Transcript_536/m.1415 type:complete len:285 (-) Transcript_536:4220-5074(-)
MFHPFFNPTSLSDESNPSCAFTFFLHSDKTKTFGYQTVLHYYYYYCCGYQNRGSTCVTQRGLAAWTRFFDAGRPRSLRIASRRSATLPVSRRSGVRRAVIRMRSSSILRYTFWADSASRSGVISYADWTSSRSPSVTKQRLSRKAWSESWRSRTMSPITSSQGCFLETWVPRTMLSSTLLMRIRTCRASREGSSSIRPYDTGVEMAGQMRRLKKNSPMTWYLRSGYFSSTATWSWRHRNRICSGMLSTDPTIWSQNSFTISVSFWTRSSSSSSSMSGQRLGLMS